jgi:triosephosphate isomerase
MKTPVIIVNFKAYDVTLGQNGLELARMCEQVAKDSGKSIAIAPQTTDLALICKEVKIPVLSQHVDNIKNESRTGYVSPHASKSCGAAGTLINHPEHKLCREEIGEIVKLCKSTGLISIVCANSLDEVKSLAEFSPDFMAIEPPELIGSGVSVTSARPELIRDSAEIAKKISPNTKMLCGAGIKSKEDIQKALELGTAGVLLASCVVKSDNPKKVLEMLADGL